MWLKLTSTVPGPVLVNLDHFDEIWPTGNGGASLVRRERAGDAEPSWWVHTLEVAESMDTILGLIRAADRLVRGGPQWPGP